MVRGQQGSGLAKEGLGKNCEDEELDRFSTKPEGKDFPASPARPSVWPWLHLTIVAQAA